MAGKIFIPGYWPFWTDPNQLRRFDYTAVDGSMPPITSVFAYDEGSKSMLFIDYDSHLTYKDTWYYQYWPQFGVAEYRDDYPNGKKVVMSPPIGWGEWAEIGGSYVNYPKMSPFKSWPPSFAKGVQCVAYEALIPTMTLASGTSYNNVLQFTYLQSWDGKPGTGARYFMALGVGPIAVQWLAQNPTDPLGKPIIETARMDAVVTDVGGPSLVA
jgi:hypothetical protein